VYHVENSGMCAQEKSAQVSSDFQASSGTEGFGSSGGRGHSPQPLSSSAFHRNRDPHSCCGFEGFCGSQIATAPSGMGNSGNRSTPRPQAGQGYSVMGSGYATATGWVRQIDSPSPVLTRTSPKTPLFDTLCCTRANW
jgi:hypothetical protein